MYLNKKLKSIIALLFVLSFLTGICFSAEKEIIILHTNDIHGNVFSMFDKNVGEKGDNIGGLAHVATKICEMHKKYPGKIILVDAGDISQGTPVSNVFYGAPVTEFMNHVKYDAATFGNHEFDWNIERMREQVDKRNFPMICANLVYKSNGKTPEYMKPYIILEKNGLKIGLIGVITPETPRMSFPKNTEPFKFLDPAQSIEKYRKELNKKGVKVIGVVSHIGYEEDRIIAKKLKGISFIVGGHSHTFVTKPEAVNGVPVLQGGCWGKNLGFAKLIFDDKTGQLVSWNAELLPIISKDIPKDVKLDEILNSYNDQVKDRMAEVIGTLSADISHSLPASGKIADTAVGKLMTDILKEVTGADVAVHNTHGLRASMTKGDITRESVFKVLPFDNNVITYDIKGTDMKKFIEYYVDRPSYTQLAGVSLDYDSDRADGDRCLNIKIGGQPIDPSKTYKIASIDYLHSVSQDNELLKNAANVVYGLNMRDEVEKYIEQVKDIKVPESVRINVLKNPPSSSKQRH